MKRDYFEFKHTDKDGNVVYVKTEVDHLPDLLERFAGFLRACTYHIDELVHERVFEEEKSCPLCDKIEELTEENASHLQQIEAQSITEMYVEQTEK